MTLSVTGGQNHCLCLRHTGPKITSNPGLPGCQNRNWGPGPQLKAEKVAPFELSFFTLNWKGLLYLFFWTMCSTSVLNMLNSLIVLAVWTSSSLYIYPFSSKFLWLLLKRPPKFLFYSRIIFLFLSKVLHLGTETCPILIMFLRFYQSAIEGVKALVLQQQKLPRSVPDIF